MRKTKLLFIYEYSRLRKEMPLLFRNSKTKTFKNSKILFYLIKYTKLLASYLMFHINVKAAVIMEWKSLK
jgi:hypothetical protein